jgi:hypothetical protein
MSCETHALIHAAARMPSSDKHALALVEAIVPAIVLPN